MEEGSNGRMNKLLYTTSRVLREPSGPLRLWLLAICLAVPGMWLVLHNDYSLLLFLIVAGAFGILWSFNRIGAILLVFSYLLLLGDLRRIASMFIGAPRLDPLLIVGPLFAIYVAVPLVLGVKVADGLSKAILALTALMTLAIFNPRQGPIAVGLSGGLFFLIPIFWFWIARQFASDRMLYLLMYRVLVPLGVLAALLGIYQTYVGFLPWEDLWIKASIASGYVALNLGNGHIRSFGFSVNSVEYGTLLQLATVCVVAAVFAGRRAYALLLPVLLTAMVLASQRGALLKLLLGIVVIWAVRSRNTRLLIPRIGLGVVVGLAMLFYSAKHASQSTPADPKGTAAGIATSHVTQGLAHPFDRRYSTAGLHTQMFVTGIVNGFKYPIGSGLGSATLGAGKFGGDTSVSGSSEVDISDVFSTTGFIGGLFYVFTIGVGFQSAWRFVRSGPRMLSYAIIGVLTSMLGGWIPLGQYALGPFVWFCLGFLAHDIRQNSLNAARYEAEALEEQNVAVAVAG